MDTTSYQVEHELQPLKSDSLDLEEREDIFHTYKTVAHIFKKYVKLKKNTRSN